MTEAQYGRHGRDYEYYNELHKSLAEEEAEYHAYLCGEDGDEDFEYGWDGYDYVI
jgi:hypothetical protein